MTPYQSPDSPDKLPSSSRGGPCLVCGSLNTRTDDPLRPRPGILPIILFGWLAILVRSAFSFKTHICRDCGAPRRYRTAGNQIALAILLFVISLFIVAYFS